MDKREHVAATPPLSPLKDEVPASSLRTSFFRSEHDAINPSSPSPLPPRLQLETKLNFQYRGDIFGQHGVYSDASLYMSRLPSSRKGSILRPKAGTAYLKLAPMESQQARPAQEQKDQHAPEKPAAGSNKSSKVSRKRQYALAVEAMAESPALRSSLLSDNVIPSLLSLVRTKDFTTMSSCIASLCFLSSDPVGREAVLKNTALAALTGMSTALASPHNSEVTSRQTLLHNFLAMLANLTIEDAFESVFVKEKALESLVKHRKATPLSERMCVFAIINLSAPTYSYVRVDDVIRAIYDLSRDSALLNDHREMLSRALYNLGCIRVNQPKLIDGDAVVVLRSLIVLRLDASPENQSTMEAARLNALMTLWHLADNPQCRRALTRPDCVRALVETLRSCSVVDDCLKCTLMILTSLAPDEVARQRLSGADLLDVLAELVAKLRVQMLAVSRTRDEAAEIIAAVFRLIAIILSTPSTIEDVNHSVLAFLLAYQHDESPLSIACSRYVLFSLASILWWSDNEESDRRVHSATTTAGPVVSSDAIPATQARTHIDELLDDLAHLGPLFDHVETTAVAGDDSPEVQLQMLLLYNMSFRYNKLDVARRAAPRLQAVAHACTSEAVLSVICGTLFCLCQEFETHRELHASGTLAILPILIKRCSGDLATQTLCLDVVCIVFDGRMLPRCDLVALMQLVSPSLVELCETGTTALRASCAACFARFASVEECRPAMGHHDVIRALAILANEEDTQTLRLCVSAYSLLSRDTGICAQLIRSGIIKSLTFLAAAPEEAVRRACAMTLCNLSTSEDNIGALAKAGALKALLVISCVKSNDPETRRICMKAVMNLLRLPTNIPLLCQDGLIWAFGLFTSGMESKDYDILCDAFCALAFYPATRKGIAKPGILTAMLQVFDAPSATIAAKIKLLKGVSNVLCDLPHAAQLIHAGILPHLMAIVGTKSRCALGHAEGEARMLVAQVFVVLFQSCPDAEAEFAEPEMLRAIDSLLHTDHDDCARCCSILLYQMSLHAATRRTLVLGLDGGESTSLVSALPRLFTKVPRETQALLVRLLYNISCDPKLNRLLDVGGIVSSLVATMPKKIAALAIDVAAYCAGLLRNLSCEAGSHRALMEVPTTSILQRLFDVDDDACKEDVAVCICNLFMGHINSSALLARGVLHAVLWLCSSCPSSESRALGTTVVRKLALAPGNVQTLVDGGVISHLALLMQDSKSLVIKTNCIATFCCVSRQPGVAALLASYGVIASVLELLESQGARDPLFEAMCVDLLSALAAFARADDPVEGKLSSILYHLIDSDESATTATTVATTAAAWQTDRSFLRRDATSPLPPPTPSSAHQHVAARPPTLRHTLYPIRFAGYAVDFPPMASTIDSRTIEPAVPSLATIGEAAPDAASDAGAAGTKSREATPRGASSIAPRPAAPPSRFAFSPLAMFPKLTTPFAAKLSTPPEQHPL